MVQDKIPLRLREEIPQTPDELVVHPELAPAHVGAAEELVATAGPAPPPPPTSSST